MSLAPIRKLSKFFLPTIRARDRPIADQIEKRPPNLSGISKIWSLIKPFALALFGLLVTTKKWEKAGNAGFKEEIKPVKEGME